jgi:hypothetical protein
MGYYYNECMEHGDTSVDQLFFHEDAIISNFFLHMLVNSSSVIQQQKHNYIHKLDCIPVHFALTVQDC